MSGSALRKPDDSIHSPVAMTACGLASAADIIGDRWALLIIREALYGVTRFEAMRRDLGAPRTVLSQRLKKLCALGILTRRPYKEPGQRRRDQYVLTAKGLDLAVPLMALMEWGDKHIRARPGAAELVDRATGAPCRIGLLSKTGAAVDLRNAKLRIKDD